MNFLKESENPGPQLKHIQQRVLIAGAVGLVLALIGAIFNKDQFFQSYLFAYIFWIQIAIGALIINMIHHVSGGTWSALLQRFLEAAMLTLPLMAVLFIPLLFGMESLYPWAGPEAAHDHILQQKAPYLNVPFFIVRAVFYFIIWIAIAHFLRKWSLERDKSGDQSLKTRLKNLSAPGILILGITITFASVDWMMSLEPHWFSTIYGMRFGVSAFVSALSFVVMVALWLQKYKPFSEIMTSKSINDWGSFLLAGVMLWAYLAFSQYLIVWSGNLKEEIPWYLNRAEGGWQWLGLALIFIHFILPFIFLLTRNARRTPNLLMKVAAMIFVMRIIDIYWRITPAFYPKHFHLSLVDIVAWIGVGGLWLFMFTRNLMGPPLLPMNDPFLKESSHHEHQEVSHAH